MSSKHAAAVSTLFEYLFVIVILFAIPVLASLGMYGAGSAFGKPPLPTIGYGISCANTNASSTGFCALWTPKAGSYNLGTVPGTATSFVALINWVLITISIILGLVALVYLGPAVYNGIFGGRTRGE
jgi:hypothetical protein